MFSKSHICNIVNFTYLIQNKSEYDTDQYIFALCVKALFADNDPSQKLRELPKGDSHP